MRQWLGWIAVIAGLVLCINVVRGEEKPSAEAIQKLIADLDVDEFAVRQEATKQLASAGAAAAAPLQATVARGSPEASWRALEALGKLFNSDDDLASDAAADGLVALQDQGGSIAARAGKILLHQNAVQHANAIKAIQRLGGEVRSPGDAANPSAPVEIFLDADWQGGNAGLKKLARIKHIGHLHVWSVTIDEQALETISKLKNVSAIDMFGAGLDEDTSKKVAAATGAHVEWRSGGYMGVQAMLGQKENAPLTAVIPGTPAEKAGLLAGDRIVKLDGIEIKSYELYQKEISKKAPGEKVSIVVERGEPTETISLEATLGQWHRKFFPKP